jgi:fatty-acid peroxygenase
MTAGVPTIPGDSTLAFGAEGYRFGHDRFERYATDAFRARLAGRRVTFLRGADAARFFYEGERFTRNGGVPPTTLLLLQDVGSVQTLDGEAHRHRKALFLDILDPTGDRALLTAFREAWDRAQPEWLDRGSLTVMPDIGEVLTDAALTWAGIPHFTAETRERTREFLAMIDGAGSFGVRNLRGQLLRRRTERWARDLIRSARAAHDRGGPETPLRALVAHRDEAGRPLDTSTLAVELLNLLRPTVATVRFIAFAAVALHQHPQWRERVDDEDAALAAFTQEVRRTAPFFPVIGGRALRSVEWQGIAFRSGEWVILDLFATNRHPRLWQNAWSFDPERFLDTSADASALVPQGSGAMSEGHRCPGEPVTVDLLAEATRRLAKLPTTYTGSLRVDLSRLPAAPDRSGVVLRLGRYSRAATTSAASGSGAAAS